MSGGHGQGRFDRLERALALGAAGDDVVAIGEAALRRPNLHETIEFLALRHGLSGDVGERLEGLIPPLGDLRRLQLASGRNDTAPALLQSTGVWVAEIGPKGSNGDAVDCALTRLRVALSRTAASADFCNLLYAALTELVGNAAEHGKGELWPVFASTLRSGELCASVVDVGPGVLETMRRAHPDLGSGLDALSLCLVDGQSGTGQPGRGHGFKPLFQALATRRVRLRFRSSTAEVAWTAEAPDRHSIPAKLLPERSGFVFSLEVPLRP